MKTRSARKDWGKAIIVPLHKKMINGNAVITEVQAYLAYPEKYIQKCYNNVLKDM